MIRDVFNETYSSKELIELGGTFAKKGNSTLYYICYVGATLQKDALPDYCIRAHLLAFPPVLKQFNYSSFAYRQIIVPFFKNYWKHTFEKARFRFRNPRLIEKELKEAFELPSDKSVQKILDTMSMGLGVQSSTLSM